MFFKTYFTGYTCHTPTMALAIRMRRMTNGSTKAVMVPSPSSNQARVCKRENVMQNMVSANVCQSFGNNIM